MNPKSDFVVFKIYTFLSFRRFYPLWVYNYSYLISGGDSYIISIGVYPFLRSYQRN